MKKSEVLDIQVFQMIVRCISAVCYNSIFKLNVLYTYLYIQSLAVTDLNYNLGLGFEELDLVKD